MAPTSTGGRCARGARAPRPRRGRSSRTTRWRSAASAAAGAARSERRPSQSRAREPEIELRTRVFVYGTLLAGERNHHHLERARLVAEARTPPAFTLYDFGPFPGMVATGNHTVVGEVYEVD